MSISLTFSEVRGYRSDSPACTVDDDESDYGYQRRSISPTGSCRSLEETEPEDECDEEEEEEEEEEGSVEESCNNWRGNDSDDHDDDDDYY